MKLVKESIKFERGLDPYKSMNIGRKVLIEKWIKENNKRGNIIKSEIGDNLEINATDVDISMETLSILPEYIKFGRIEEDFKCTFETEESLRALPYYIGGNFKTFYINKPKFTKGDIMERCQVNGTIFMIYSP